ncbi:glycogen debranching protein GlgX [Pseudactinotalea sp.]|uniref:glycogen debranching protein GlgX n=1 Tax=Pseudactinotalea sp. TaxID=1926260 RepID=UPI003B3A025B
MTTLADPTVTVLETTEATMPAVRSERFGVHLQGDGVDVVVSAPFADRVWLCLLDEVDGDLVERRVALMPRLHGRWHAHVPGVRAEQRYGFRVEGPWDPDHGMRHNPAKLLLDPYGRGISGGVALRPEIYGHPVDDDLSPLPLDGPDERDSAPYVAHGVVLPDSPGGGAANRPGTTWSRTVIYEAHVQGLTLQLPGVPEHLRGTYAGLAHPQTIEHLRSIGVTALELLPIHAKMTEPALQQRGVDNYWGYNTLSFFAPEPRYATRAAQQAGPAAVLDEVKGMVQLLHEAGIEVLLDVVYNHTCEGGVDGPTLSWRGLDDFGYYLRDGSAAHRYLDVTGCGNSLDFRNHRAIQLTLDSLRYWVQQVGVDGFRFDLMTTLARRAEHVDMEHPLLVALASDQVLSGAKLIAEPWDLGPHGWQTGHFPPPISEWNDRYRDCARTFWLTDAAAIASGGQGHDLRDLATRLAGSADMFAHTAVPGGRGPVASVNFLTAHDGFTLADLVSYDVKHNHANGEDNRDGTDDNRSWNHGVEGETDDAEILAARRRAQRNLLGMLFVSAGTPMLTAGDEFARTQHGNNNAYCSAIDGSDDLRLAVDWHLDDAQRDQLATVQHLAALRRDHVVLRPWRFRRPDESRSGRPTLMWFEESGEAMSLDVWHDPHRRVLQKYRVSPDPTDRDVLVVINGAPNEVTVTVPSVDQRFELVWDSAWERPEQGDRVQVAAGQSFTAPGMSLRIYLTA